MLTTRDSLNYRVTDRGLTETVNPQQFACLDKYVGGSEGKIRAALQMVSAMPNVLLMIDG